MKLDPTHNLQSRAFALHTVQVMCGVDTFLGWTIIETLVRNGGPKAFGPDHTIDN